MIWVILRVVFMCLKRLGRRFRRELAWALYYCGFGVALHDFAHQVWELKGYHNFVEGGYIGFGVLLLASFYLHWRELRFYVRERMV